MTQEPHIINTLRDWLAQGATIKATDPSGEILQLMAEGRWHGGLTVEFPSGGSGVGFTANLGETDNTEHKCK